MHRRTFTLATIATALALAAPLTAQAQAQPWPHRPIKLLVGFAPGGGTDIVARALAPKIAEVLGTPVVVENRAGAAGTIAADLASKSTPDGYTFLVGHSNSNAIAPNVLAKTPYDAANDFTAVTYIGYVPNVLVVNPAVPATTVDELIALTKKKPDSYTYASSGVGSTQHLAGALFARLTGSRIVHIPYKGSGQAVIDLLAGQVDMNFDTLPPVLEHIRNGKLRALAISTPQRLPQLPDVPTFAEVGIKGFDVTNWYSIMAPRGLPPEVTARMDDAVRKAMQDPAIHAKLESQGLQSGGPSTPEAFDRFLKDEIAKYARLTRELGVRTE